MAKFERPIKLSETRETNIAAKLADNQRKRRRSNNGKGINANKGPQLLQLSPVTPPPHPKKPLLPHVSAGRRCLNDGILLREKKMNEHKR